MLVLFALSSSLFWSYHIKINVLLSFAEWGNPQRQPLPRNEPAKANLILQEFDKWLLGGLLTSRGPSSAHLQACWALLTKKLGQHHPKEISQPGVRGVQETLKGQLNCCVNQLVHSGRSCNTPPNPTHLILYAKITLPDYQPSLTPVYMAK